MPVVECSDGRETNEQQATTLIAMIGQVALDQGGDLAIRWLMLAAVAGSVLSDVGTNLYVWQRGVDLGNGERLPRYLPFGLTVPDILAATILRAALAAIGVGVLAWLLDQVTGSVFGPVAAAALGALVPAAVSMIAGVRATGRSSITN